MKPTLQQNLFVAVLALDLSGCGQQTADAPPAVAPAAEVNTTNPPAPAGRADVGFAKLTGNWQRADGDSIVEIRGVEPGGKMDAAYLNPQPIHVAVSATTVPRPALAEPATVNPDYCLLSPHPLVPRHSPVNHHVFVAG